MTNKAMCQQAYRRMRVAQVHAQAVLLLGNDMTAETVDAAVAHLNECFDQYRARRAMHECPRYCIQQSVVDEDAVLCPDQQAPTRRAVLLSTLRKVRTG